MAYPSVTYTFSNSTTADATQVNQNFTDLINGLSDGTKDLQCAALTTTGNVILGNATSDTLTLTAVLSSSIALGTDGTYDIGTTAVGLRALYFGDGSGDTVKVVAPTLGADWTLTLPIDDGLAGQSLTTDGAGTATTWGFPDNGANYGIAASVAASALTISLKTTAAADASSSAHIYFAFRNATAATGTPVRRTVTGALSVVVSSGSTLGHTSAKESFIYVYALDNSGTVELAVSSQLYDQGTIVTTTAEGGAGAADSLSAIYSTTARSNVPIRLIGRMRSTQATAGTWATAISEISLPPFGSGAVFVRATLTNATTGIASGTIVFNSEVSDTAAAYNNATGLFTAPRAGFYSISTNALFDDITSSTNAALSIMVNGATTHQFFATPLSGSPASQYASGSTGIYLSSGDTVAILASGDASFGLDNSNARAALTIWCLPFSA